MKIEKWNGQPIAKPGYFEGIPIDTYHGGKLTAEFSVSSSGLRTLWKKSPKHFWAESSLNPKRDPYKTTPAKTLGSAAHHLILGEDHFTTHFVVRPDEWKDWKTKASQDWKKEQQAAGRSVLVKDDLEKIEGMANELAKHPLIQAGILNGQIEKSMVWRDKDTGIWCRARPDVIPTVSGDFADLKTTTSVSDESIRRTMAEYNYPMQGALVNNGYTAISGNSSSSFSLVFCESEFPHCVRVVTLLDRDLALAERQNNAALRILKQCLDTREWPGPGGDDGEFLGIPEWVRKDIEYRLEQLEAA